MAGPENTTLFITLSGFLGAGKTTLMSAAADAMRHDGQRVVLVTNDQGDDLLDTATATRVGAPVREVTGGCFCCRFDDLAEVVVDLLDTYSPDVVIAEAVGSCTDLTATVIRPLRRYHGDRLTVAPLAVVLDPARLFELGADELDPEAVELGWLLHTQLEDADLIVVSKSDQYPAEQVRAVVEAINVDYPHTPVVVVSSLTGEGLSELVDVWRAVQPGQGRALTIDYQRYGQAEALLAWGDRIVRVTGDEEFSPDAWVDELLGQLSGQFDRLSAVVGHVKVGIQTPDGRSKASLVGRGPAVVDDRHGGRLRQADVLINARVGVAPDVLAKVLDDAVSSTCATHRVDAHTVTSNVFAPKQPVPTHRIAD